MFDKRMFSLAITVLLTLVSLTLLGGALPATAQIQLPKVAITTFPAAGQAGFPVSFFGVGFTPNGRVSVAFALGAGLPAAEITANGIGQISGSFVMPSASALPALTGNTVDIFAVDRTNGARTLPAHFEFSPTAPLDYDFSNGHFFTQANGFALGAHPNGFGVTNEQRFSVFVRFFDEFLRLGSVPLIGFPVSQRFVLDGFETQAFQKAIFQWRPERDEVFFINVLDVLHDRGFDDFLFVVRSVPRPLDPSFDAGKTPQQVVADRLALLNANPAIRDFYFSVDNPTFRFGLPTSRVVDNGNHFAIRLQRAVLQQWKVDVPWARAGQVVVANGGDIAKEVGLLPNFAEPPQGPPVFGQNIVVFSPTPLTGVRSPFQIVGDARVFEAVVNFDLLDARGNVIASGNTLARNGTLFARFDPQVAFVVTSPQDGILRVFNFSAATGEVEARNVVNVRVTLSP
ncbi:MAG: Gmad2 immunoglobulin-like domain-containing protein [Chloroflexi bacterium]|nr:Gmad2 immunoglobulin-like domain-containing protein [Chloroflexota bacterium]